MILNIEEIFKKLRDNNNWEPVEFINHRREILRFEKVAAIELDGKNYAYLYEIDDDDEHVTDFPAVIQFEEKDGEYLLDFVTDKNLIEDIAYEVVMMRREENSEDTSEELDGEDAEFYDEDEHPDEDLVDGDEEYDDDDK